MANFNKAFNFRGGFQVDTDVLVVRGQNVGIGSSIPNERLVVDGIIQASGLDIKSTESVNIEKAVAGLLTVTEILDVGIETGSALPYPEGTPQVRLTTGIITAANPAIGVVTYYGDGGRLLNLPTSQWLDIDVGLGFTSIYAQGYVGVNTTDPRYVFQVGGVPFAPKAGFNTSQTGVGIETGSIYVSDNISVGKTVSTLGEFIGVGSLITDLNASALKYGAIGSDRFGDINAGIVSVGILTASQSVSSPVFIGSTFVGDTFSGIAQTAVGVVTTAQLVFDTAVANEYRAINRFISTEGVLQIGDYQDATVSAGSSVGDVDVYKFNDTSYIYSLSSSGNSKVFVGREREGSVRREFGGLRYGGSIVDGESGDNDLDVVNYDVGNLNFYLHSGSGGINDTEGSFRWIYGQNDLVLASLDKNGGFVLNGNSVAEATLDVTGIATFRGDTYVNGALDVEGLTTIKGDITVDGTILVEGGIDAAVDVQFKGADFSAGLTVAGGVYDGDEGVGLTSTGKVEASQEINVVGTGDTTISLKADGTIFADSTIQSNTNVIAGVQASSPRIVATTTLIAPGNFIADATGLAVDDASITNLTVTTSNVANASATDLLYTGRIISGNSDTEIQQSEITTPQIYTNQLDVVNIESTGTVNVGSNILDQSGATLPTLQSTNITATGINVADLTVTTTLDAPNFSSSGDISGTTASFDFASITDFSSTGVSTIQNLDATNADINTITNDVEFAGDPVFLSGINVAGVATVQGLDISGSFTSNQVDTPQANVTELNVDDIRPLTGSSITIDSNVVLTGVTTSNTLDTDQLFVSGTRISPPSDAAQLSFNINSGANGTVLSISVTDGGGGSQIFDIPLAP